MKATGYSNLLIITPKLFKNVHANAYLVSGSYYFTMDYNHGRLVYTEPDIEAGISSGTLNSLEWTLKHVNQSIVRIGGKSGHYLYASGLENDSDRREVFTWPSTEMGRGLWELDAHYLV